MGAQRWCGGTRGERLPHGGILSPAPQRGDPPVPSALEWGQRPGDAPGSVQSWGRGGCPRECVYGDGGLPPGVCVHGDTGLPLGCAYLVPGGCPPGCACVGLGLLLGGGVPGAGAAPRGERTGPWGCPTGSAYLGWGLPHRARVAGAGAAPRPPARGPGPSHGLLRPPVLEEAPALRKAPGRRRLRTILGVPGIPRGPEAAPTGGLQAEDVPRLHRH